MENFVVRLFWHRFGINVKADVVLMWHWLRIDGELCGTHGLKYLLYSDYSERINIWGIWFSIYKCLFRKSIFNLVKLHIFPMVNIQYSFMLSCIVHVYYFFIPIKLFLFILYFVYKYFNNFTRCSVPN